MAIRALRVLVDVSADQSEKVLFTPFEAAPQNGVRLLNRDRMTKKRRQAAEKSRPDKELFESPRKTQGVVPTWRGPGLAPGRAV